MQALCVTPSIVISFLLACVLCGVAFWAANLSLMTRFFHGLLIFSRVICSDKLDLVSQDFNFFHHLAQSIDHLGLVMMKAHPSERQVIVHCLRPVASSSRRLIVWTCRIHDQSLSRLLCPL